jgi:hypothetical protein
MQTNLLVVDDFFDDPDAVRRLALSGTFVDSTEGGYTGSWNSSAGFEIAPSLRKLARALGADVVHDPKLPFSFRSLTRKQYEKKRTLVHHDRAVWVAFVCLTPPSLPQVFTAFYRHRATGLYGLHDARKIRQLVAAGKLDLGRLGARLAADSARLSRWVEVARVGYAWNRLIIMRARQFHAAGRGFGTCPENAKLTLLIPFEIAEQEQRKRSPDMIRTRLYRRASTKSE